MDSNKRDSDRQKATLALYFFKENNNQELFGKWDIYVGKKYVIGRKNCDINIDHPLLSRRHLELIFYTNDLINVRDLGSRNGTYINNAKANPYQEIKFSSKDKLSLGDINNKVVFLEYQETKKSIFESKVNNASENNDQKASEDTKKIVNYDKRRQYNNQYNQYNNNRFRNRQFIPRNNRYRFNYRFRPRSYHKNNYMKPKTRDVHSENYNDSLSSETYKSENKDKKVKKSPVPANRYQKKIFEQYDNFKKENEIIGKKVERNKSESKNDKKNEKKNLEKLIKSKKIGLEKLKKKLKSIENSDEEEEIEEEEDELELFDEDDKKGKNQRIIFRTNKLNDLEFVVPVNDKNLKNLKNVKKIKYLVNGYMVLNVKKKKLIYE